MSPCLNVFDSSLDSLLSPVLRCALKESLALMAGSAKAAQYAPKSARIKLLPLVDIFCAHAPHPLFFERRSRADELRKTAKTDTKNGFSTSRHKLPKPPNLKTAGRL